MYALGAPAGAGDAKFAPNESFPNGQGSGKGRNTGTMSRHTMTSGLDALFLRRVATRLDRGAAAAVRGRGLTVDQWRMLDLLAGSGPLPMAALCEELSLAGATATRVADRLVAGALAYRSIDDTDRRRVVLGASERGLEVREQLSGEVEQAQTQQIDTLDETDHGRLVRMLGPVAGRADTA